ncbi:hypothetical protein BGZ47_005944 [Haplosporangium gracile]|nr:hypothetical protein BGZ47_005944 [Haplosporangium gracile]
MTSSYAASDVADSFEDLSSLSSNKDIESLVLATVYNDDDDDDVDKNKKSTDTTNPGAEGTATKENDKDNYTRVDDVDDDFVDLVGADVEDEGDVLSEGWDSSRSASPEPQDVHQDSSTLPAFEQPENQASTRLLDNRDTKKNKNPTATTIAKTATRSNTNPTLTSLIPKIKIRMTKGILAALNKPAPSASVALVSSTPPNRVVTTSSHLRLVRQNAIKTTTTTTDTATSLGGAEPKKTVVANHQTTGAPDQTAVPTAIVDPSVPSATAAAFIATEKTQKQEKSDGICKAIRRSTGKRCTRHDRHDGYCSTHRLLVK